MGKSFNVGVMGQDGQEIVESFSGIFLSAALPAYVLHQLA
jgi:hypothetical protein